MTDPITNLLKLIQVLDPPLREVMILWNDIPKKFKGTVTQVQWQQNAILYLQLIQQGNIDFKKYRYQIVNQIEEWNNKYPPEVKNMIYVTDQEFQHYQETKN